MEISPIEVSTATVAILAQFMPYLVNVAKFSAAAIAEMVIQKGGEAAWQRAQALWSKIKGRYHDDGMINGATIMLAAQPDNRELQTTLVRELALRWQEDKVLLQEIETLLGGHQAIQEVLADHSSWVEDVTQKIKGTTGRQVVKASEDSVIIGVRQIIKK